MPEAVSPARLYYTGCQGRWRAPVDVRVTDPAALRASGMAWLTRVRLRLLAAWPPALGRLMLHTTVALDGEDVVHTTAIRWLGVPLAATVERFRIDPDGRRLRATGGAVGEGEVDATGTRATYALTWFDTPLRMTTRRHPDAVEIDQEGAGWRGRHVLARVPDPAPAR